MYTPCDESLWRVNMMQNLQGTSIRSRGCIVLGTIHLLRLAAGQSPEARRIKDLLSVTYPELAGLLQICVHEDPEIIDRTKLENDAWVCLAAMRSYIGTFATSTSMSAFFLSGAAANDMEFLDDNNRV